VTVASLAFGTGAIESESFAPSCRGGSLSISNSNQ
jgi:hypothetical protein